MTTNATNYTTITADLPDFASGTIKFVLLSSIAISGTEVFPGKIYTMTLDVNGVGSTDIPTPDGDGTLAWLWDIELPDGHIQQVSIAWAVISQDIATILAAAVSTTTPSDIAQLIINKVSRTGDTMTGALVLSGDPTIDLGAATKKYVDDNSGGGGGDMQSDGSVPMTGTLDITAPTSSAELLNIDSSDNDSANPLITLNHEGVDSTLIEAQGSIGAGEITTVLDVTSYEDEIDVFKHTISKRAVTVGIRMSEKDFIPYQIGAAQKVFFDFVAGRLGLGVAPGTRALSVLTGSAGTLITSGNAGAIPLTTKGAAGQAASLTEWANSAGTILSSVTNNGAFSPPQLADASAANNTIYYSTDASKLVYKDPGGVVNNLY